MNKSELLQHLDDGYAALLDAIGQLDAGQMLTPAADGWSAKDQLAHIAAWERGMAALLSGRDRPEAMGVPADLYDRGDYDATNAHIWQTAQSKSLATVMAESQAAHAQIRAIVASMSETELQGSYGQFYADAPAALADRPVIGWIKGNTYEHYEEHIPLLLAAAHADDD